MKLFVLFASFLFTCHSFSHEAENHKDYLIHTCDLEVFKKQLDKKLGEIYDEYYGDLRPDAVGFYFTNMMLHQRRVFDDCHNKGILDLDKQFYKQRLTALENENTTDEWYKELTRKYEFDHLYPEPLLQIYSLSSSISTRKDEIEENYIILLGN